MTHPPRALPTPLSVDEVCQALVAHDPHRWMTWRPASRPRGRGTDRLRRRLAALGEQALATQPPRGLAHAAELIDAADVDRPVGLVPDVPPLGGRHPIVLAHGPSLAALVPAIDAHRHRLYAIAPLRTALRLAERGVVPDIVTLADASPDAYAMTERAWTGAPAAVRRALADGTALVVEALAPRAITADFPRVRLFDDGLGWLPEPSLLPWWGSALVPSVALALRLGAEVVAVGGIDMTAARGRRSATWAGGRACLTPAMAVAHALLEAIATALPGRFVDVSAEAIVKRGFVWEPIERFVERTASPGTGAVPMPVGRAADILEPMRRRASGLEPVVRRMAMTAARVSELAAANRVGPELEGLVAEMERDWRVEPMCAAALSLAQASYLTSIQQLCAAGIAPQNRIAALRMKARLVGPEVTAIESAYREWLSRFEAPGSGATA